MHHAQTHTLENLFDQLGLESDDNAIDDFIFSHPLGQRGSLKQARFWTLAQRQFIEESWQEDSDWCEVIDQLDSLLRAAPPLH